MVQKAVGKISVAIHGCLQTFPRGRLRGAKQKFMPAEITAKIVDFPSVLFVERGGCRHGRFTDGVFGHGFGFHGRFSF